MPTIKAYECECIMRKWILYIHTRANICARSISKLSAELPGNVNLWAISLCPQSVPLVGERRCSTNYCRKTRAWHTQILWHIYVSPYQSQQTVADAHIYSKCAHFDNPPACALSHICCFTCLLADIELLLSCWSADEAVALFCFPPLHPPSLSCHWFYWINSAGWRQWVRSRTCAGVCVFTQFIFLSP